MMTPESMLDAVMTDMEAIYGPTVSTTAFRNAKAVRFDNNELFISVPSRLEAEHLEKNFLQRIERSLRKFTGLEIRPVIIMENDIGGTSPLYQETAYTRYTFKNFIVGPSNRFAHAAALGVARSFGVKQEYNPLTIYGPPGLGKTHLLYAIANEITATNTKANVVYVKSETMMNDLATAAKTGMWDFRSLYRTADILLVDDIQFFVGKSGMQEEFFNTFNILHEMGKQIVLTADRPPRDIPLEERLQSRFIMGLPIGIESPDLETRILLIDEKSSAIGLHINEELTEYLAGLITRNVRHIEGAVNKIKAMQEFTGTPLTKDNILEAIADLIDEHPGLHPTMQFILDNVADYYGIPAEKILGNDRTNDISVARQTTCFLMKELTEQTLPIIGSFLNLNHTSVMYGIKNTQKRLKEDYAFLQKFNELRDKIEKA